MTKEQWMTESKLAEKKMQNCPTNPNTRSKGDSGTAQDGRNELKLIRPPSWDEALMQMMSTMRLLIHNQLLFLKWDIAGLFSLFSVFQCRFSTVESK